MSPFGEVVRRCRRERLMTVRAMASLVGRTPGYISRIETRGELPSPELICELAVVLEVDAEGLLALAKTEAVHRVESAISERHQEALRLFRKTK